MAKFDRILCPFCLFTSKYIDLIINQDGNYVCPECGSTFFYEEIMQLYGFTQLLDDRRQEGREPFTL
jgi:transposase-like protein